MLWRREAPNATIGIRQTKAQQSWALVYNENKNLFSLASRLERLPLRKASRQAINDQQIYLNI